MVVLTVAVEVPQEPITPSFYGLLSEILKKIILI